MLTANAPVRSTFPLESKGALESLTSIETQITLLKTEEAGLWNCILRNTPSYKAVLDKLAVLGTRQEQNQPANRRPAQHPTGSHPP